MSDPTPTGPDLTHGIPLSHLRDGHPLAARLGDDPVLLLRRGAEVLAIGGACSHYGGPLSEGLITGDTVRCPWHHACFSLRTGSALRAPALRDVPAWTTRIRDGRVFLDARVSVKAPSPGGSFPASIVVVGAGAAGSAAVEALRRNGYAGPLALVDPDQDAPYDRPNLSKDFLAGTAPAEWIPLFEPGHYERLGVERLVTRVTAIHPAQRTVSLEDGRTRTWDALLLATGAAPRRLLANGTDLPVHVLRSLADCRAIINRARSARCVVVIGSGFLGLEAAAALRQRGLEVTVIGREPVPLARVLGQEIGRALLAAHERQGVAFQLGRTVDHIGAGTIGLDDGTRVPADLVLAAIGVQPEVQLAEAAGLATEDGIVVDRFLRTATPGIWAAGDVARFPDPLSGQHVRIEHWALAQRHGQVAAANMLGKATPFLGPAFFWTRQHDVTVHYVGHAPSWDSLDVEGAVDRNDATLRYRWGDQLRAVATLGRDRESLEAEVRLEHAARLRAGAVDGAEE